MPTSIRQRFREIPTTGSSPSWIFKRTWLRCRSNDSIQSIHRLNQFDEGSRRRLKSLPSPGADRSMTVAIGARWKPPLHPAKQGAGRSWRRLEEAARPIAGERFIRGASRSCRASVTTVRPTRRDGDPSTWRQRDPPRWWAQKVCPRFASRPPLAQRWFQGLAGFGSSLAAFPRLPKYVLIPST